MKRAEIAKTLSRRTGLSKSKAREEVDELVTKILDKLRNGRHVKLPGVGKLVAKTPK